MADPRRMRRTKAERAIDCITFVPVLDAGDLAQKPTIRPVDVTSFEDARFRGPVEAWAIVTSRVNAPPCDQSLLILRAVRRTAQVFHGSERMPASRDACAFLWNLTMRRLGFEIAESDLGVTMQCVK